MDAYIHSSLLAQDNFSDHEFLLGLSSVSIRTLLTVLNFRTLNDSLAASWRKRLGARLPPLGSRVRVSVPPCGFRGGRNEVWVGFSRGFSRFPLPPISFHHFSTLISFISFHFIRPCDGASGVVGRHPCYSRTYNVEASSHLISRRDLVLDTSWGYKWFSICRIWDQFSTMNILTNILAFIISISLKFSHWYMGGGIVNQTSVSIRTRK